MKKITLSRILTKQEIKQDIVLKYRELDAQFYDSSRIHKFVNLEKRQKKIEEIKKLKEDQENGVGTII